MDMHFRGYPRPGGGVGVRNHLLVVPTVICASVVAERVAAAVPGGAALPHLAGCGQLGPDLRVTHDTRAERPEIASSLLRVIDRVEAEAIALGLDIRGTQPSPGNIRGGLTTIEEKSLGATHKGGERTPLSDVVSYAAPITAKGLTVMDT